MNPMSTETQPIEHAMRAAEMIEYKSPWSTQVYVELRNAAAKAIDQHAIAPAVAERDRRIAELEKMLQRWLDWVPEPETMRDIAIISDTKSALAKHGGAHE